MFKPTVRHLLVCLVALVAVRPAHADDPEPVYVAGEGRDIGDCTLPVRPCQSISYALSQARKGTELRVAGGTYAVDDVEDVLRLLGGSVRPRAGYSRFDHFAAAASDRKTVITGVPPAFRDQLMALGFDVVADAKKLDAKSRQAVAAYRAVRTSSGPAPCADGSAGLHACRNVDLLARVALADMSAKPSGANDIWGFADLNTEREYALLGLNEGLAVFDVTEPTAPVEVGFVPGHRSIWRDVKVVQLYDAGVNRWRTFAYVTVDAGGRLSVLDLTELPHRVRFARRMQAAAHNVYVSSVDFAFGAPRPVGTPLVHVLGAAGRFNHGAFRSFDPAVPLRPTLVIESSHYYVHDAVSFRAHGPQAAACRAVAADELHGPSADAAMCEVLVTFNEYLLELWDVTDPDQATYLSWADYPDLGYVHSGWVTEDGRYLFVHDEYDEVNGLVSNTLVRVFDLADLLDPVHVASWEGPDVAIEHNGAVRGNRHYLSHYGRGLVVLDVTEPTSPVEVGHFDTAPAENLGFGGAWGIYPFLPSGNLLVSDMSAGLFVLGDRTRGSPHGRLAFAAPAFGGEEGDEIRVSVRRMDGSDGPVGVDYAVVPASADAADFTMSTGTLEWAAGDDRERHIAVPLNVDDATEPVERLHIWLTNPRGGAVLATLNIASVFVSDPRDPPRVGFLDTQIAVDESAGRVVATVRRLGDPTRALSVRYDLHGLTAEQDADYIEPASRKLTWGAGDARPQTLVIPLVVDDVDELAEQFEIHLVSPVGGSLGADRLVVDIGADGRPAIDDLMLFDEDFGWDVARLVRGTLIEELPERVNFRAVVRHGRPAASVRLTLSGPVSASRVVPAGTSALLFADAVGRATLPDGEYQLLAAAYAFPEARGALVSARATSFRIAVPTVSVDAGLASLAVGDAALDGFAPDRLTYRVDVPHAVASVDIMAIPAHAGASLVVADATGTSTSPRRRVPLEAGDNSVSISVTAQDRVTTRIYTVTVNRAGAISGGARGGNPSQERALSGGARGGTPPAQKNNERNGRRHNPFA